jgi:uncharacterized protein YkwD
VARRFLAAGLLVLAFAPAAFAGGSDTALESSVLQQINQVRRDHGLQPLRLSARLSAAAVQHSNEMGADGYFAHESADHSAFWKRVQRWYPSSGWRYWTVGENLLWSSPDVTPARAVELWMNSPEHRANLLNRSWREIGLSAVHLDTAPGTYGNQPVTILTADFGFRR